MLFGVLAQNWNRRQDPTENLRIARGSQRVTAGVPSLPPIEVDVASIATQLREHDARRGSEDRRDLLVSAARRTQIRVAEVESS